MCIKFDSVDDLKGVKFISFSITSLTASNFYNGLKTKIPNGGSYIGWLSTSGRSAIFGHLYSSNSAGNGIICGFNKIYLFSVSSSSGTPTPTIKEYA